MANYWPHEKGEIADFVNALPKIVFSRTLSRPAWNNTRAFKDDAPGTVARLKREMPKDIYLFGGADLAASLFSHGLFDEFRIGVTPHLLGGGTPLFKRDTEHRKLKLIDSKPLSTGIVILRYVPAT